MLFYLKEPSQEYLSYIPPAGGGVGGGGGGPLVQLLKVLQDHILAMLAAAY